VLETPMGPVVRLRGEAGVPEASALQDCVLSLVARRLACVTFDLSELGFISSLAMGVLVTYRRAAVRAGVRVCLAADLQPAVREALDRVGLLGLFAAVGGTQACSRSGPVAEESRTPLPHVSDGQRAEGVTWGQLVDLEPELGAMLRGARMAGAGCRTYADVERAFSPVRNELAGLIGFTGKHRRHPVLGSVGAYEAAYQKLYDAVAGLVPRRPAVAGTAPQGQ
jgi:anti-anti-sigma factor